MPPLHRLGKEDADLHVDFADLASLGTKALFSHTPPAAF